MRGWGFLTATWVLVAVAIVGSAHVGLAGWSPDGVTVRATDARIPLAAACSDGGAGAFVAWQESSSDSGTLRVQHLLSTGDLDASWPPDGALASAVVATRQFIEVVPDRQGGVYVCWVAGSQFRTTRLDPSGQVAAGWPPSGTHVGSVNLEYGRPRAIEDGSHGLYVAWSTPTVFARRFGPDGLGAGGWPNGPRIVATGGTVQVFRLWPDLALAPDGGVFVSWANWSSDTTVVYSGMYLRRLTGAGANMWSLYLGPFRPEVLGDNLPRAPLLDIAPDDRGGVFWVAGELQSGGSVIWADARLHRSMADGQTSPGWPPAGRAVPSSMYYDSYSPDDGLRVHPDGQDGVIAEWPTFPLHSPIIMNLSRCSDGGQWSGSMEGVSGGHEVVAKGDGGAFMATFRPRGPSGPYQPNAFLSVKQSPPSAGWTDWGEGHPGPSFEWYGDIALAPVEDGGVVFFWSQVRERYGLFARRFTTAGQVTAVEPGPGAGRDASVLDHLRFVHGTGVVARVALRDLPARLDLFDLGGRRVSLLTLDGIGSGAVDVTLPGTASLTCGLYFARLAWEQSAVLGKVAVVR